MREMVEKEKKGKGERETNTERRKDEIGNHIKYVLPYLPYCVPKIKIN